jgi:hypothetical protein
MTKRPVAWKPVKTKNIYGEEYINPYMPNYVSGVYRGTLLSAILAMPRKKPISFQTAAVLAYDESVKAFLARRIGNKPGECNWFYNNFVQWISEQGYHIELTGDEFESHVLSDKVS